MPPDPIRDVLEGVLRLMGSQDTSWNAMRSFLAKTGIKDQIINFDAHRITPDIRREVEMLLDKRGSSFEHDVISRVSKAAAPLASWVKANLKFSEASREPKEPRYCCARPFAAARRLGWLTIPGCRPLDRC